MTYRWRAGEVEAVVEYAPYVMREDIEPDKHWTHEQRAAVTKPFNPDLCGELGGYRQHVRFGQDQCPPCKAALARENARLRANAKAKAANEGKG